MTNAQAPAGSDGWLEHEVAPLVSWIIQRHAAVGRPFVVGISGAQGSGKSALAARLAEALEKGPTSPLLSVTLSLDDLYLSRLDRERLATEVHPLLRTRGVPGTHDPALGHEVLSRLVAGDPVALPRFDKLSDERLPPASWPSVDRPAQVVFFEGWCVGCPPQAPDALTTSCNSLEREADIDGRWRRFVQAHLENDYRQLFARLDALVFLHVPSFEAAFNWRLQQEQQLANAPVRPGTHRQVMDAEALTWFMQHYERLSRHMLQRMPSIANITMYLTEDHRLSHLHFRNSRS